MHGLLSAPVVGRPSGSATAWHATAGFVALLVLASGAACGREPADHPLVLERRASSEGVPFTQSPFLSLVGSDRACLIDSYESQVVCGGPAWRGVERFGREGHGPGEFYALQGIAALPSSLGLVDFGNRRVTLLAANGRVEATISFDGYPTLIRDAVDSTLLVLESDVGHWIPGNLTARRKARIARVQLEVGTLHWDTLVLPEAVPVDEMGMSGGAWSPEYGYVFLQYPYQMVRFSPAGEFLGILAPAHYQPEMPSDRDVETRVSDLTQLFGRPPGAEYIEEWRETPKRGVIDVQNVTFSEDGLLWVATTRDRTDWSYIDVYAEGGRTYLGSVRVRDRLLAFDVRQGTLAALVERKDRNGVPRNRIGWYETAPRIGDLLRSHRSPAGLDTSTQVDVMSGP